MKNIILVGNGPSLLQKKLGDKIDSFETVVRFNNFQIDGYESHVGSKCDILARRSCDDVKLWPEEMFPKGIISFVTYCLWTSGMVKVGNQLKGHYSNIEVVAPHVCAGYGRQIKLDQPSKEWASVGALAMCYFLEKFETITLCGFDHLAPNNEGKVEHYFAKPPKDDRFHSGEKERIFTESMISQGRIERLT
jgi:hypothetical protein